MKPRAAVRARPEAPGRAERVEVESCLARWGLIDRPRHLAGAPPPQARSPIPPAQAPPPNVAEEPFGRRLRGALQDLGPLAAAFGRYLASRIDLLAAADCLELSRISGRFEALPIAAVHGLIAAELGRPAATVFAAVEPDPCESGLLVQGHRASLAGGQPVVLWLVRPGALAAAERDLPRLALLAPAFARQGWRDGLLDEALADFQRALRDGADLASSADALGLLALDAEGFGLLAAPAVRADLGTARLLTVTDPGGVDLVRALEDAGAGGDGARRRRDLARLVCVAWLRQALEGRVLPLDLTETGARVLGGGSRLAFLAGSFARPPLADRANLRGFLIAMAAREPDDACSYLLREMTRRTSEPAEHREAAEEELRLLLRQVMPFRDGAWTAAGASLAEHLFVCARQARACGFLPRPQLLAFYRGLASVATAARQLAPQEDVLLEALQEVRVLAGWSQLREALSPQLNGQWGRYAMLLSEMPRKVDELLTVAAAGGGRQAAPAPARRSGREAGSQLLLGAVLMVLAALALLLHEFVQAAAIGGGRQRLAAIVFAAIGGALVWKVARSR
jgi:ubiquinone biosynthesis protein